jgi:hypothetical protein
MDLALARHVETRLPVGKLDATQFSMLIQACRRAKERLLGPNPPDSEPVTVVGRGRSVVGGTVSIPLTLADVTTVIGEGFFPDVTPTSTPKVIRGGLHEMGLPYVADAAVTRHLAAFLARHLPEGQAPDAILFNGGVFTPQSLRDRLLQALSPWYEKRKPPLLFLTPSLDLAVAYGAAAFAWIKHTGGRAIGGGTARSYYVEVGAHSAGEAATVLCVVPRHLEEHVEISLPKPELELTLGEPVSFPLYTSTARDDKAGAVLTVSPEQLRRLPSLTTVLRAGKRSSTERKVVPVTLAARTTAIGTLELACVANDGGTRWRLEFSTREIISDDDDEALPLAGLPEVVPESMIAPAAELVAQTFAGEGPAPNDLTRAMEAALESPRDEWPTAVCRRLWEALASAAESRRRTPAHLARWYNLVGFCLRPGFGDAMDRHRIDTLWKLLHAPKPGLPAPPEPTGADAWILWRRVAGGLGSAFQKTLFDRLRPTLLGKSPVKPGANELAEMWRAAASLERLDAKTKTALGEAVLKRIAISPAPTYAFWSVGRLGARSLLYGPLNSVVHPETVGNWLDKLLPFQPGNSSEKYAWAFCLAELARRTGQRALDIDESRRSSVMAALRSAGGPAEWQDMVREVSPRTMAERAQAFGDSLPIGLRLRS